jgi:hypothetical protein
MDIENKRTYIKALEERIDADTRRVREAEQEIAEHLCPFSVGDPVVRGYGVYVVIDILPNIFPVGYSLNLKPVKTNGKLGRYSYLHTGPVGFALAT